MQFDVQLAVLEHQDVTLVSLDVELAILIDHHLPYLHVVPYDIVDLVLELSNNRDDLGMEVLEVAIEGKPCVFVGYIGQSLL